MHQKIFKEERLASIIFDAVSKNTINKICLF